MIIPNHHVCPSNIAWMLIDTKGPFHLLPREWQQDVPDREPLSTDIVRSDGMFWNVYKDTTLCGLKISESFILISFVGMDKHKACETCWNRRW